MKVHHIGILVRDIHKASATYAHLLNQEIGEVCHHEEQQIDLVCFHLENIIIELIAPDSVQSPLQSILNKRGEGIHHIALEGRKGPCDFSWIYKTPRKGEFHSMINFIHPNDTHGVLIEISNNIDP